MEYAVTVKEARLRATQQALNNATLELLMGENVCAQFQLERISAVVLGDMLSFIGFPKFAASRFNGRITSGRIVRPDGATLVHAMRVGLMDSRADIRLETLVADVGNIIRIHSAEIQHA